MTDAWVLWWRYSDGSGSEVMRVYLDEARAKEDFALFSGVQDSREFKLDRVAIFGRKLEASNTSGRHEA